MPALVYFIEMKCAVNGSGLKSYATVLLNIRWLGFTRDKIYVYRYLVLPYYQ